jgi:hypothetical protein
MSKLYGKEFGEHYKIRKIEKCCKTCRFCEYFYGCYYCKHPKLIGGSPYIDSNYICDAWENKTARIKKK